MQEGETMKSFAVLYAPNFRIQAVLRHSPELIGKPIALLEDQGAKHRICEMTAIARKFRVEPGMTPTQAMARCPEIRIVRVNDGQERSAQEAVLQIAENLSPFLESTKPGVVTIELPAEKSITAEFASIGRFHRDPGLPIYESFRRSHALGGNCLKPESVLRFLVLKLLLNTC